MARRPRVIYAFPEPDVPPDTRPIGSLQFADAAKARFTDEIHVFNVPYSPRSRPEEPVRIRSVTAYETTYYDPKRTGHHDEEDE